MRRLFVAACALLIVGCGPRVDLKQALSVTDVTTGWYDAGVVDGKNKLVPSITFRLRDTSDADLSNVSLNLIFRNAETGETHEEVFKQSVPLENDQTDLITIRAQTGYTGDPPQTRLDMLQHRDFRDMDAVIYARQSSGQWVELSRVRLDRQLLTQTR